MDGILKICEWDLQSVGIVLNLVCSREIYDLYMLIYTEKKNGKGAGGPDGPGGFKYALIVIGTWASV